MILGRISGSVVSTIHHPIVNGRKLLVAERLDAAGRPTGGYLIAVDAIGAGQGETVLIIDEGTGARQILDNDNAPVRSVVVGIVDEVALETSRSSLSHAITVSSATRIISSNVVCRSSAVNAAPLGISSLTVQMASASASFSAAIG